MQDPAAGDCHHRRLRLPVDEHGVDREQDREPGDDSDQNLPSFAQGPTLGQHSGSGIMGYYYAMRSISERSTDPGLLVLSSLAGGPKHGYAITKDVEEVAGVRLGPGTLYGALSRLEERGLIEAMPSEDRRRPYRLTGDGSAV